MDFFMKKITISENYIIRRIAQNVLLVPMIRELSQDVATFTLNPTAAEIIGFIEEDKKKKTQHEEHGGKAFVEILEFMSKNYPDVNSEQLQKDIHECIDDLQEIGAVLIEDSHD